MASHSAEVKDFSRLADGVLERKEALLTTLSSYSLQHETGRVFRSRVLCHRKSKRRQVEIGEQCFSLTEYNGCKREL